MPYRRRGTTIYVKKGNRWQKMKTHPTVAKAKKHQMALNINVRHRNGKKKK